MRFRRLDFLRITPSGSDPGFQQGGSEPQARSDQAGTGFGPDCDVARTGSGPGSGSVPGMNLADRGSGPGRQVASLDGLRGVAILGVLSFHTGHLSGGFLGVDLFFALSGYLLTGLLLREVRQTGAVSLVAFWGRRIRRLFPALAVMIVGTLLLVWTAGTPDQVRAMLSDGPWVQLNVINWQLLAESAGYWGRFGSVRVFEHLWSIAVEEQFYLGWPVLVLLIARWGRRPDAGV